MNPKGSQQRSDPCRGRRLPSKRSRGIVAALLNPWLMAENPAGSPGVTTVLGVLWGFGLAADAKGLARGLFGRIGRDRFILFRRVREMRRLAMVLGACLGRVWFRGSR